MLMVRESSPLRQMNPRITKARAHKFKVGTCYMVGVSRIGILECFDVLMFSNIQE